MNKTPKETEDLVVKMHKDGKSTIEISKEFLICPNTVCSILKRNGLKVRGAKFYSRVYTLDEDFFNIIDTEEKAYWLGFIVADGYNSEDRGVLSIDLNVKDFEHLEKFKKSLSWGGSVKKRIVGGKYEQARVRIHSRKLSNALVELEVGQAKTFTTSLSKKVPKHMIRHFIRGLFDGDGGLNFYEKRPGNTTFHITGNLLMMETVQDFLVTELNLKKTKFYQRFKDCEIYTMRYIGNLQVKKIINFLYEGSNISLDRKLELANKILAY